MQIRGFKGGSRCANLRSCLTLAGALFLAPVPFQNAISQTVAPSAEEIRERTETLQYILKKQPPDQVVRARYGCATGQSQDYVRLRRSAGFQGIPDAAEYCVAALYRLSYDGKLGQYYQTVLIEQNGRPDGYEQLPAAIAAAVMKDRSNQVPLGNQKALVVTAALAFDAGFSVAYQGGTAQTPGMPNLATLKPIAERCLKQEEQNLGLCYSSGYVYGARAVSRAPLIEGR